MITLEKLQELLSYDPETGIFTWLTQRQGGAKKGTASGGKKLNGYINIKLYGKDYLAHRLAWLYVYGELPESFLDHINEIKDDNKISNLRLATRQENYHNISKPQKNNKSGLLGVCRTNCGKKWRANICLNGKIKYLGVFNTAEEASEAYLKAKRELHTFWEEKTL
jgi:hypothetical protein